MAGRYCRNSRQSQSWTLPPTSNRMPENDKRVMWEGQERCRRERLMLRNPIPSATPGNDAAAARATTPETAAACEITERSWAGRQLSLTGRASESPDIRPRRRDLVVRASRIRLRREADPL